MDKYDKMDNIDFIEVEKSLKRGYGQENLKEDLKIINDKLDIILNDPVKRIIEECIKLVYQDNHSMVKTIKIYKSLTNCDFRTSKYEVERILFNK